MDSGVCSICRQLLVSEPGFYFCSHCGTPYFSGNLGSAFEVLGAPKVFTLDEKALEVRYYSLSKLLHPDRFSTGGNLARLKSQELSAALNGAYLALRHPEPRIETLLREAGALNDSDSPAAGAQIPSELAEEYFELQETAIENPAEAKKLGESFHMKLEEQKQRLTEQMLGEAMAADWTTSSDARIKKLLEFRRQRSYILSMLENLDRLGVGHV